MLKHIEDRYTVQVTCAACRVQFVVILAVQGDGIDLDEEQMVAAESEAEEMLAEPEADPIEADEVLDVHLLLRDFEGRLVDLLPKEVS